MLPAITAAKVAAERNQQAGRERLQEVEGHLDDSPRVGELADAMRQTQAAGEGMSASADRTWWAMCVGSVLCFAVAIFLFFRPARPQVVRKRSGPAPDFDRL